MIFTTVLLLLSLLAGPVHAEVGKVVGPLSCGIYDDAAAPLVQAELDTQHVDPAQYTMQAKIKNNKLLTVMVSNASIRMIGERNNVTVLVDGKPLAKTSHQDLPLYLEVHIDEVKYRIICIRADIVPLPGEGSLTPSAPRRK